MLFVDTLQYPKEDNSRFLDNTLKHIEEYACVGLIF